MSLDLRKKSLERTYAEIGAGDRHGLPINKHMNRCLMELEQWFGVKMYLTGGNNRGFWVIGFGEKPEPWPANLVLDAFEDEDPEDDDDDA